MFKLLFDIFFGKKPDNINALSQVYKERHSVKTLGTEIGRK